MVGYGKGHLSSHDDRETQYFMISVCEEVVKKKNISNRQKKQNVFILKAWRILFPLIMHAL